MSTLIPQAFIDELTARADIVEVIGTRVQLKKAGKIYKGLCPFHEEKNPVLYRRTNQGLLPLLRLRCP